jgi:hypothetical protein
MTGAALLLGTMGGIGSLIAFFGLPQVRAYNRLSIFIAFCSIFAVALWLDQWTDGRLSSNAKRAAFGAALLLALALLDQVSPRLLPDYRRAEDEFMSDEIFVKKIETQSPPGSMVFQLPVVSFPENPKVHRLNDSDLVRGYLHGTHLRWSYGARGWTSRSRPITTARCGSEGYKSDRPRIGRMRQIVTDRSASICYIRSIRGLLPLPDRPRISWMRRIAAD